MFGLSADKWVGLGWFVMRGVYCVRVCYLFGLGTEKMRRFGLVCEWFVVCVWPLFVWLRGRQSLCVCLLSVWLSQPPDVRIR